MKRSPGLVIFGIIFILAGEIFLPAMPLFSVLYLIVGVGIFFLEPFARYLAIFVSILGIIINTKKLIGFLNKNISMQIVMALAGTYLVYLGIIYFFTRPKVKEQFRR